MGKILVIGSLNIDMVMKVDHMPTAGETILCDGMKLVAGGKGANQACAAGRLGTDVTMLGAIGNDSHGEMQRDSLQRSGVDEQVSEPSWLLLQSYIRVRYLQMVHHVLMLEYFLMFELDLA